MLKLIWNYCVICWIGGAIYYGYEYFANSDDRTFTKYAECGYAAEVLAQKKASDQIGYSVEKIAREEKWEFSQYQILKLVHEAKEKVRSGNAVDIFNSSYCRDIHKQPELTNNDLINLIRN